MWDAATATSKFKLNDENNTNFQDFFFMMLLVL